MDKIKTLLNTININTPVKSIDNNNTILSQSTNILNIILDTCKSEIGFIGLNRYKDNIISPDKQYLQWITVSNIAWDDATKEFYKKSMKQGGIKQYDLNNLFGLCLKKGEVIISNNPLKDDRRGGQSKLPNGHPKIDKFLGIPLIYLGEIVGIIGLANYPNDYTTEYVNNLKQITEVLSSYYYHYSKFVNIDTEILLEIAKDKAEKNNKTKNMYLSRMSHELRTPLNSILGFSQLIKTTNISASTVENVDSILKAGRFMLSMINDILDIAKIEEDNMLLSIEDINLNEILLESLELVEQLTKQKNISIYFQEGCEDIIISTDKQRLKQVIINILSNAIKYNKTDGNIKITFDNKTENYINIYIKDTGIGISKDKLQNIYKPFDRLGAEKSDIEGSGLGLALTKRLINKLNGKIDISSVENESTTVKLSILMATTNNNKLNIISNKMNLYSKNRRKQILYVEDNFENYKLMKKIVEKVDKNIELIYTTQGNIGVELANNNNLDIILLDYNLPDITGEEVLKTIKKNNKLKHIPIYIISANVNKKKIKDLINLGAVDYITKPFDVHNIISIIQKHITKN